MADQETALSHSLQKFPSTRLTHSLLNFLIRVVLHFILFEVRVRSYMLEAKTVLRQHRAAFSERILFCLSRQEFRFLAEYSFKVWNAGDGWPTRARISLGWTSALYRLQISIRSWRTDNSQHGDNLSLMVKCVGYDV